MEQMKDNYVKAAKIAGGVLVPGYGLSALLIDTMMKSVNKSNSVAETGDIDQLQIEARMQEIESKIAEFQAKVAQELAIAKRIENAAEVEIEEFYDTEGSGGVGLQLDTSNVNLGVSGTGKRVSKRVYRFKGWIELETVENEEDIAGI